VEDRNQIADFRLQIEDVGFRIADLGKHDAGEQ
jgi:hypothetical protein